MKKAVMLMLASIALTASPIKAEASADEFIRILDRGGASAETATIFLHGISNGLDWANTELKGQKRAQLYCVPPKLGLSVSQSILIFRDHLKRNPENGQYPAGLVMLEAMRTTFPCKSEG
jgi:hypothetical protein